MSVYFYGCVTLDGYLADTAHGLGWLDETGSTEETGYERFYQGMDITLMGRRTFQVAETLENPSQAYPTTKNYVFTHKKAPLPAGFEPINCDVADFTARLPRDKNIWVVGGNTLLAPLLDCDLIDFLIIQIAPVLLGDGIPLFTQKEALKRFRLDGVRQYGQFAELHYSRQSQETGTQKEDL